MRRAWKSVQCRGWHDKRISCFACQILKAKMPHQGLYSCSTDTFASTPCPCSSTDSSIGKDVMTLAQTLLRPTAPHCSSSPSGPLVKHETVKERGTRIGVSHVFRFLVDITRDSGGTVSPLRRFSSGVKSYSAVRLSHATYATAAAIQRDYVVISTNNPEQFSIQPSLASVELVDLETLAALEVELTEEDGTLSHVSDLEAKLRCLRDWGLTDEELAKLRLHVPSSVRSALLKNSAKKLTGVATFLVEECGVPKLKVADAFLGNVFLASSRIEDCLRPKVIVQLLKQWLGIENISRRNQAQYLLSLGITKEQVGKIVVRFPQILTYNMEQRVLPMQRKLIECGLKMEDIGKAVMKYPGLLGTGINKIDRTVEFLKAAGVVEIAKCICRHPQILSLSLDGKVHNMTAFLKSELLLEPEIINKTISIQPSIFTYSVDFNVRPKVMYFISLGLERREIGRMIAVHPAIMGHSLESSIKPKIDFLLNVMKRRVNEIVSFPHYLSYSLSCRIQPRHEYLVESGRDDISLSSMLSCRPEIFLKRYSTDFNSVPPAVLVAGKLKASSRQC